MRYISVCKLKVFYLISTVAELICYPQTVFLITYKKDHIIFVSCYGNILRSDTFAEQYPVSAAVCTFLAYRILSVSECKNICVIAHITAQYIFSGTAAESIVSGTSVESITSFSSAYDISSSVSVDLIIIVRAYKYSCSGGLVIRVRELSAALYSDGSTEVLLLVILCSVCKFKAFYLVVSVGELVHYPQTVAVCADKEYHIASVS